MRDATRLKPDFRLRPQRSLSTGGQFSWIEDDEIDMTVQVQRVGLLVEASARAASGKRLTTAGGLRAPLLTDAAGLVHHE